MVPIPPLKLHSIQPMILQHTYKHASRCPQQEHCASLRR